MAAKKDLIDEVDGIMKFTKEHEDAVKALEKTKVTGKLYGYARVSSAKQNLTEQLTVLADYGVPKENIFNEKMSGADMSNRKELEKLKKVVERGDTVVVHKLDRLGRSVSQVTTLIADLTKQGVFVVIIANSIDTRNISNGIDGITTLVMITVLGLMAELEKEFIKERTKPAIERAKENGVKFGRKIKNQELYDAAIAEFIEADGKKTVKEVIEKWGVDSKGKPRVTEPTFFRKLREYRESQEAENA